LGQETLMQDTEENIKRRNCPSNNGDRRRMPDLQEEGSNKDVNKTQFLRGKWGGQWEKSGLGKNVGNLSNMT